MMIPEAMLRAPAKGLGLSARASQLDDLLGQLKLTRGRLPEASLATLVLAVASRPHLFEDLVVDDPDTRWWMLLHEAENFDLRVLSWRRSQATDWHDHGGASGAYAVTRGALVERFRDVDNVSLVSRQIGVGQFATFGPSHVHDVVYGDGAPAVSIHAYSPPLTGLTVYDRTRYGFVAREVVPEERRAPFETPVAR
jgi:Cysteine dioxygenase type I